MSIAVGTIAEGLPIFTGRSTAYTESREAELAQYSVKGSKKMETKAKKKLNPYFYLLIIVLSYLTAGFCSYRLQPILTYMMQLMSIDEAKAGTLVSAASILSIFLSVPFGVLMGRIGPRRTGILATLLVSPRKTSRYLLFDTDNRLQGWVHKDTLQTKPEGFVYEPGQYREYAFSGIHVISPELFHYMEGEAWNGKFPIMDFYLHTCRQLQLGGCIKEDLQLIDIGKPDTLARAEEFLKD